MYKTSVGENNMTPNKINATDPAGAKVQERILKVAEKLFSERGFEDTSIRDITAQAQCNLAGVNYHFGGKENLYIKVFQRHLDVMRERRISSIHKVFSDSQDSVSIENLLDSFCRAFIAPFTTDLEGRQRVRLMIWEMQKPHLPDDMFVREVIKPVKQALEEAILKIYPCLDIKVISLCIQSLVQLLLGQFMHVIHGNLMPKKIHELIMPELDPEKIIEHVVRFTSAGIKDYVKDKPL